MTLFKHQNSLRPVRVNPFDNFFRNDLLNLWDTGRIETIPSMNIRENKDHYRIELAAPGLKKEDFNIEVSNNVVTISCEKEAEKNEEGESGKWSEYDYSSFSRSFTLPDNANVNAADLSAKYNDGVLCLDIPKKNSAVNDKSRKITVK